MSHYFTPCSFFFSRESEKQENLLLDLVGGNDCSCCSANGSNCFFLEERKKKREEEGGLRPDYGIFFKEREGGRADRSVDKRLEALTRGEKRTEVNELTTDGDETDR